MNLLLHISIHILLGLVAGFIAWKLWKRPFLAFFSGILGGVAVDVDHLVDYFLAFGIHFNLNYFIWGYSFLKSDKIYLLFHAWEYVVILLVLVLLFKNKAIKTVFFGLALGLFFHLSADVVIDKLPMRSYSIIYRAKNNFDLQKIVTPFHWQKHLKQKEEVKFN
jgi:hypothetical protein